MSLIENAAAMAKKQAETTPEEVVVVEAPAIEMQPGPEIPMAIHTEEATVVVYGHHHVSKRDVELSSACLMSTELPQHGVRIIRFVDELDDEVLAKADVELGGIVINLTHTFNKSVVYCEKYPQVSIWARFQENMMQNVLHEMAHIFGRLTKEGRQKWNKASAEKEELHCEKFALDTLIRMGKTINIEPGHYTETPFFNREYNRLIANLMKSEDTKFATNQHRLLENNLFFEFETENGKLEGQSFKSYLQLASGHGDSEDWEKPTGATNLSINVQENIVQPAPMATAANLNTEMNTPAMSGHVVEQPLVDHAPNLTIEDLFGDVAPGDMAPPAAAKPYPSAPPAQTGQITTGALATQPNPVHTPTGLTAEQTGEIVRGVYYKVYRHMFGQCGPMMNSDVGFSNPEAATTMAIPLTPAEMSVVLRCDCLSPMGVWSPKALTTEGLRGYISKAAKLPVYKIYIANGDGSETCRLLVPQNPAKVVNGQLTETALKARGGTAIMHIIEGDDRTAAATGKKFFGKIEDGQLHLV